MYVQQNTLKEIFGSKYMKDLREEFRQNKKPDLCKTCWVDEENNRKSKRLTYNNEVYESLKEVDINWREEPGIPFEYQMIISNSCNLKCRSCTPSHSSQWMLEHNKYHDNPGYDLPHGQAGDEAQQSRLVALCGAIFQQQTPFEKSRTNEQNTNKPEHECYHQSSQSVYMLTPPGFPV